MSKECCGSEEKACCKAAVEAYKATQSAKAKHRSARESFWFCAIFTFAITYCLIFVPSKDPYYVVAYSIIALLGWWLILSALFKKYKAKNAAKQDA